MTKELSELILIRLQTELENALGYREHYLNIEDYVLYNMWDIEVDHIIDEIKSLGDWYEKRKNNI